MEYKKLKYITVWIYYQKYKCSSCWVLIYLLNKYRLDISYKSKCHLVLTSEILRIIAKIDILNFLNFLFFGGGTVK